MSRSRIAITKHRSEVLALAKKYRLQKVSIFGSVARGTDDEQSDLDLLVESAEDVSLLELGGFLMDIRDLLGVPVDVVTLGMLKDRSRDRVLREAVPL